MVQWLQPILQNLGFQLPNAPTLLYEYSQPTIDIINSNHLTSIVQHIYVPINYVHDKYGLLTIDPVKLKTTIHTADIGTEISTGPLIECHYSYIHKYHYYPPPDSDHYRRLSLDTLNTPYWTKYPSKYL